MKLLLGARQKARGSTKRPGKWPIRRLALLTTFKLSQQLLLTPQPRFNLGLLAYWTTVSLEGAPVTQISCCQCVDLWSSCCKLPNLFYRAKIIVWIYSWGWTRLTIVHDFIWRLWGTWMMRYDACPTSSAIEGVVIKPGMGNEEMRNGKWGNGEMRKWGNDKIA